MKMQVIRISAEYDSGISYSEVNIYFLWLLLDILQDLLFY